MNYEEIIEQLDDNKVKALLDRLQIPFELYHNANSVPSCGY